VYDSSHIVILPDSWGRLAPTWQLTVHNLWVKGWLEYYRYYAVVLLGSRTELLHRRIFPRFRQKCSQKHFNVSQRSPARYLRSKAITSPVFPNIYWAFPHF
jgi:hypothetical protein